MVAANARGKFCGRNAGPWNRMTQVRVLVPDQSWPDAQRRDTSPVKREVVGSSPTVRHMPAVAQRVERQNVACFAGYPGQLIRGSFNGRTLAFEAGYQGSSPCPRAMTYTTDLYFEAHVTIDPTKDPDDPVLRDLARAQGFRVAELLMKKGAGERSRLDDFMTTRGQEFDDVLARTMMLVSTLKEAGYTVRRYKIENTLLDVRL